LTAISRPTRGWAVAKLDRWGPQAEALYDGNIEADPGVGGG